MLMRYPATKMLPSYCSQTKAVRFLSLFFPDAPFYVCKNDPLKNNVCIVLMYCCNVNKIPVLGGASWVALRHTMIVLPE